MNSIGMPDNLQEATDEQLQWIFEIIRDLVCLDGKWPFLESREKILSDILDEINRRKN